MNADYIAAALMITTAIVWPITGCLRDLRERAEAERVAGEDQAPRGEVVSQSVGDNVAVSSVVRDASSRGWESGSLRSDTPIYDATAAHLAHAEAARDLRDERIARWLDGAS